MGNEMAAHIEESDTDAEGSGTTVDKSDAYDREHPIPSKRRRTKLACGSGSREENSVDPSATVSAVFSRASSSLGRSSRSGGNAGRDEIVLTAEGEEEETEDSREGAKEPRYDEAERLARKKLNWWQRSQVADGFLDNLINRIVEDHILNPSATADVPSRRPNDFQFRPSRGDETEDAAVATAIRNRGLVRATTCVNISSDIRRSGDENSGLSCATDLSSSIENMPRSSIAEVTAATGSVPVRLRHEGMSLRRSEDGTDDSDGEQDFLERAVVEAIKKKGLSVLGVDYG